MADLKERRRRWRGPTLGGPLQRGARFCFAAHDGEASTARLTEWCRPELVGGRVKKWHLSNQERALHSIGARKVRRDGWGWVWRLDDSAGSEPGTISRPPVDGSSDYPLTRARVTPIIYFSVTTCHQLQGEPSPSHER